MTKRELIEILGSAAKVAKFFGISEAAVSQWLMDAEVPELRALQAHQKRPDIFGASPATLPKCKAA